MKRCAKCKLDLHESEFSKNKNQKSGLSWSCKSCQKAYNDKTYEDRKLYRELHSDKIKAYQKEYRDNHKEYISEYNAKQRGLNREGMSLYAKAYRKNNREIIRLNSKIYAQVNKKFLRKKANELRRKRMETDIEFKLLHNLRRRLGLVIVGKRKADTTRKLIGCELPALKKYLEDKFDGNMNWGNYGKYWQIDHIKPCKSFNLQDENEQKLCFHYSNLQPLTAKDNRSKGAKIIQ